MSPIIEVSFVEILGKIDKIAGELTATQVEVIGFDKIKISISKLWTINN